jgi:hypothetical protein
VLVRLSAEDLHIGGREPGIEQPLRHGPGGARRARFELVSMFTSSA